MNDLTPKSTHGRHSVGETLAFTAIRSKGLRAPKALKGRGIIIEGARAYVIGCLEPNSNLNHGSWKRHPTIHAWREWAAQHGFTLIVFSFLHSGRVYSVTPDDLVAYVERQNDDNRPRVFEDKLPDAWRLA